MADLLTLLDRQVTAQTVHYGSATFAVPVGKTLKIETSPAGVDVLTATCPAGKAWTANVVVQIVESDA